MKFQSESQSNFLKNWKILIPWIVFPMLGIGVYFFSIYTPPLRLIGNNSSDFNQCSVVAFSDMKEGCNSESILLTNTSSLRYKYTLKKTCDYPYAGVWYITNKNTWLDLSRFDFIKIKAHMSSANWITLSIATNIPGFSVDSQITTHKYLNHILSTNLKAEETILPIKDLSTPMWWYNMNNKKESNFKEADLSKVKYIAFINTPNNDIGIENKVEILEMGFYVDYIPFYSKSAIALTIYLGLSILVYYYIRKRSSKKSIQFSYDKVESQNHKDREEGTVMEFLNNHYPNPDLTVTDIQSATGIAERRVSAIIKYKSGLSFKQYLNQIRMAEAKKLLISTELSISDVAYQCGYGSISHFNRVFKSIENCSPNDFKKQQSIAINT